ncbi:MAG: DNA translocase FtsK [Anaerovoracaceae bacterium]
MAEEKRKPGRPPGSKNKTGNKSANSKKRPGKEVEAESTSWVNKDVKDEIWGVIIVAVGAFLVVAFQTQAAGAVGKSLADVFTGGFGLVAYALPYYLIIYGILLFARKTIHIDLKAILIMIMIFLMVSFINSGRFIDPKELTFGLEGVGYYFGSGMDLESGGVFGMYIGSLIVKAIGIPGLYIFSGVVILICLLLVINTPISPFFEANAKRRRERREVKANNAEEDELKEKKLISTTEKPVAKPKRGKRIPLLDSMGNFECKQTEMDFESKRQSELPEKVKGKSSYETSYQPGRISSGQRNILEYMKKDDLFDNGENTYTGYGLSEESRVSYKPPEYIMDTEPEPEAIPPTPEDVDNLGFEGFTVASYNNNYTGNKVDDLAMAKEKTVTNKEAASAVISPKDLNTQVVNGTKYIFPPVDLLNKGESSIKNADLDNSLKKKAMKLEQTLENFHIDAKVTKVTQGPAVTRYEIQPNIGVKVKSIVNLSDDIALNMEAKSIRIEAPIPGKAAVGIEVENDRVNMVTLRELVESKEFKKAKSKITFAAGKDISGNAIVADLKAMPHLLIAGSTGSGKSVCVNSIILSILYKAKPEEVKLVLIDPKVVELANYNGIPHLLIPVVTEPSKAAAALNWAVVEMDDRYKKFAAEGVRDLESFNDTIKKKKELDRFTPQVVIIIDELADLMMAAPSQVEESICRLAQKARAAGMHLIVATQRPSVDVVTGVIKANIPSRVAFAVSSQVDSRTILDMAGAEKLVGKGDMLFNPMGGGKPIRVQGTFVSDSEVHDVIEFVKEQVEETQYSDDVLHTIERANVKDKDDDADELLSDAIETVVLAGQASVSMLQRRFRIGYNRAARIMDMMESRGIVGPTEGSKPRQVLMTETELYALQEDTKDIEDELL